MYVFIRLLLIIISFLGGWIYIRTHRYASKKTVYIILIASCLLLGVSLMFLPVENSLFTFDTPETAFQYYTGNGNAKLVIDGRESALVIGEKGSSDILLIVPKADSGWKVGIGTDTRIVHQASTEDVVIQLYRYGNTEEYYLQLISLNHEPLSLGDSLDSVFHMKTNSNGEAEYENYTYFAYITQTEEYWIRVNDDIIQIGNMTKDGSAS